MYRYREMTRQERARMLAMRKIQKRPWHAPPHFDQTRGVYLISAACYEHRPIMMAERRLSEWEHAIRDYMDSDSRIDLRAWAVLPNHYHLLIEGDLRVFSDWIRRLHNGKATQWNREDHTLGRKVWHRFADRVIRSERHYFASLNYIHANPVKHGYAARADEWAWSSLALYVEEVGRERLAEWWRQYPVRDYGKGWDE